MGIRNEDIDLRRLLQALVAAGDLFLWLLVGGFPAICEEISGGLRLDRLLRLVSGPGVRGLRRVSGGRWEEWLGNGGDASARVSLVCGRVLVFMFNTDGAREGDRTDVGATRVARADGVDHARGFGLCSRGLGHACMIRVISNPFKGERDTVK